MQQSPELDNLTEKLFTFGLSISKVLDLGSITNTLKAMHQMFEEYSKSSKKKVTEQVVANSTMQVYSSFGKQKVISENYKHKMEVIRKAIPNSLQHSLYIKPTHDAFFIPEQNYSNYEQYIEGVRFKQRIENENAIKPNKLVKPSSFKVLINPPISISLNLNEVVKNLCDVLMMLYNKFYDQQILSKTGIKALERIDKDIRKAIVEPLMQIIVSTALQTLESELGKIHDILMHN
jgi:hypothetical protein